MDWKVLDGTADDVASRLLGSYFVRELDGQRLVGKIVETEAYDQLDMASHSYSGIIEASVATQPQSDNFFHPKVGLATFGRKKIITSQLQASFESQPKPRRRQGKTPRTEVMFGPSGHLYVYFTYGMHYCMNVVTGGVGHGAGVLIRALEPLEGQEVMSANRHGFSGVALTNGPAKVCQALRVDKHLGGHDLRELPLQLVLQPPLAQEKIVQTTRIGITNAKDVPWRFYIKGNPYVSKLA